jgi:hypothetical protein
MMRGQSSSVLSVTGCYAYIYDRLNAKQIPNLGYLGKAEERIFRWTGHEDPYFGVVAWLVWSNDPESYAGNSVCYW